MSTTPSWYSSSSGKTNTTLVRRFRVSCRPVGIGVRLAVIVDGGWWLRSRSATAEERRARTGSMGRLFLRRPLVGGQPGLEAGDGIAELGPHAGRGRVVAEE